MMCARDLAKGERLMRTGGWHDGIQQMVVLEGKRLGVIGLGQLGSRVAGYAKAFGMDVVAWSQNLTEEKAAAGRREARQQGRAAEDLGLRLASISSCRTARAACSARPTSPR